jgi:MATE family multidrug resistance protein
MESRITDRSLKGGVREVVAMAWPIMLGAVSFAFMDFADRFFVSRYGDALGMGKDYLAAIGSSGIWSYTMGVFFLGVTGCVSTFVSQSYGKGEKSSCSRYAWQGVYISILAGLVGLLMYPLSGPLFHLMKHDPSVTALEITYFRIRILGFGFIAWQSGLSAFFQGISRPKIPMVVAVFANLLNIVLDYALVFGKFGLPEMGISGAAVATVSSLILQSLLLQAWFMSARVHREYRSLETWRPDFTRALDLFRIGWPAGLSGLLDVMSWSVFTSFIVGSFATAQLAGHNAAIGYMHIMFIPVMALNFAATAITGQWIGRGEIPMAKQRAYIATGMGICIMLTLGILMAVFGPGLIEAFSTDATVIDVGSTLLIYAAIFAGFDAVSIVLTGALRGAGDTRWIMVAMFLGSYFVSLPLAWLFSSVFGLEAKGAWVGATIYIIGLSGAFLWRFQSEKWRGIKIFFADRNNGDPEPTQLAPEQDPVSAK